MRLPQAYAGRILVLTTAGKKFAFPETNEPSGAEGNHANHVNPVIQSTNGRGAGSQVPSPTVPPSPTSLIQPQPESEPGFGDRIPY